MTPIRLAILLVAVASTANAQTESRLSLLGFNEEGTQVLVKVVDPNQGTILQARDLETAKIKKGWLIENKNDETKRVKDLRKKTFKVPAVVDQVDPEGRFTVFGSPDKKRGNYDIMVMRDGRVGVLGSVPLKTEGKRAVAKAMLKEVVWAADGKTVYCIVNQKLERETGPEDVDDLHVLRFKAWKVKWVQAPVEEPETEGAPE